MLKHAVAGMAALGFSIAAAPTGALAAETSRITGEAIDTWCYFSGVMGGPDAVVGSAHHTCALWCSAGGIPTGILTDDGDVYMVLTLGEDDNVAGGDGILALQSDRITVDGVIHERDGLKYIAISEIVENEGIVNRSHEDFGVIPPFAIPEPTQN